MLQCSYNLPIMHDNNHDFPYIGDSPFPNIPPIELHCLGINKVLKNLDPSKAAGPDGLPSKYLKLITDELTPSLFLLFSATLQHGRIPADWKRAMITPIFKKGLHNDPQTIDLYHLLLLSIKSLNA